MAKYAKNALLDWLNGFWVFVVTGLPGDQPKHDRKKGVTIKAHGVALHPNTLILVRHTESIFNEIRIQKVHLPLMISHHCRHEDTSIDHHYKIRKVAYRMINF